MQNKKVLAILLAMMMFLTACGTTPESGHATSNGDADLPTINWTVQSCDNAGTARYVSLEQMCERLSEATDGKFTIDLYASGTLFPIDTTIDSVKNGLVNAAFTSGDYHAGYEPMLKLAIYRTCDTWVDDMAYDEALYQFTNDLNKTAYENLGLVYVGSALFCPGEILMSKKPITNISDFNGLLMRTAGLGADLYSKLGVGVVSMPMGDVYQAAKLGTVDAFEVGGWADNYSYAYSEVADYIIEPCPHMAACSIQGQLVVNKESWAELPVEYQNILKELIDENRALAFEYAVEQDKIAEENFKKDGVEIIYLSDEDIAAMKVMGAECLAAYWDASKLCTEYLERYVTFMRDNGFGTVADTIEAARK